MIDVDADGTRARRRTWMLGGSLFIASAFFWLTGQASPFPALGWMSVLLLTGGMAVFAIGFERAGSVTARRPLGTSALLGLAVWNVASPLLPLLARPHSTENRSDALAHGMTMQMVTISSEAVGLALAIVAVTQIARLGMLPAQWRWAPLWALIGVVAARLLLTAFMAGAMIASAAVLQTLSPLLAIVIAAAECFLGVLAIVLAARRDAVTVYG